MYKEFFATSCKQRNEGRGDVLRWWAGVWNCTSRQLNSHPEGEFVGTETAEGEAEPGKKIEGAAGHSFIHQANTEYLLCARYSSRLWGYRSRENMLHIFMMIVFLR